MDISGFTISAIFKTEDGKIRITLITNEDDSSDELSEKEFLEICDDIHKSDKDEYFAEFPTLVGDWQCIYNKYIMYKTITNKK